MKPIAVFYHGLFSHGTPREVRPSALAIVCEAMNTMQSSGLTEAASEIHCCFNGTEIDIAKALCPSKAQIHMHGNDSFAENLTHVLIEEWVKSHPDWYLLYFHAKACTHDPKSDYYQFASRWRRCMLKHCVEQWRDCVAALDSGKEAVGVHWLTGMGSDRSQHFFAGNFHWVTSNFRATIPSIYTRDRIKESGIAAAESRYESEVILGNGPRLPVIQDLCTTHGLGQCP